MLTLIIADPWITWRRWLLCKTIIQVRVLVLVRFIYAHCKTLSSMGHPTSPRTPHECSHSVSRSRVSCLMSHVCSSLVPHVSYSSMGSRLSCPLRIIYDILPGTCGAAVCVRQGRSVFLYVSLSLFVPRARARWKEAPALANCMYSSIAAGVPSGLVGYPRAS